MSKKQIGSKKAAHDARWAVLSGEAPEPSKREEFLNSNPDAKRLFGAMMAEFGRQYGEFKDELKPMLRQFINKAEMARQIGITLIEFTDTLPGKKLTKDFYEQHKADFRAACGETVAFELLEWFIKVARNEVSPIEDFQTALQHKQPLLIAGGEGFALESQRGEQQRHLPADALSSFKELFYGVGARIKSLRSDEKYFPNGRIRPDLRQPLRMELEPQWKLLGELWKELE